jgi:thymidylate kinase
MTSRRQLGSLIILEGPDGVGKTTICDALAARLRNLRLNILQWSFPGKQPGTIGALVYRIHHDQEQVRAKDISDLAMQALHVAAHIDAIDRQILPALEAGNTVVLDRFWWSTWVYGLVAGCERKRLQGLIDAETNAWGIVRPSIVVLVRRPHPVARNDQPLNWKRLSEEYNRLVTQESGEYPVQVVDNTGSIEEAVGVITNSLPFLKTKKAQAQLTMSFANPKPTPAGACVSHILPLKPTVVFDTYWRFAAERQRIFFNRLEGKPPPWTEDPVFFEYKFTNAYRASDRVSQYLIRHVIYRDDLPQSVDEVFFRIMLFKLFNKIETWEVLESAVGPITLREYAFEQYDRVLTRAMANGAAIYSAAYIMPSGGRKLGHDRKHRNHLVLLERMIADAVPRRLAECRGMQHAFELMKSYPTIGDFLAYQYVIDINYSEITNFPESEFVVPGPGALDGIRKCFTDLGGLNEPEVIKFMADNQEREFQRLGLDFLSLWGRPLKLVDCQNLFCEVDKYARVRHPDIQGISGRSRIKQRFAPKSRLPEPWYPPKWGLNHKIGEWLVDHHQVIEKGHVIRRRQ